MVDSAALFSRTSAIGGTQTRAISSSTGQLRMARILLARILLAGIREVAPTHQCRPSANVTESAARQGPRRSPSRTHPPAHGVHGPATNANLKLGVTACTRDHFYWSSPG